MEVVTNQSRVANKLSCQPEEWLLEVVIGLGGDVVVLKVLLSVESDCLGLHLLSLTSTLLPVRTMGIFSQTRTKSPKSY